MRSATNCPASRLPPNSETPSLLERAAPNAAPMSPLTHRRTTTPSTSILARRPPRLLPHRPGRTPPSSNAHHSMHKKHYMILPQHILYVRRQQVRLISVVR